MKKLSNIKLSDQAKAGLFVLGMAVIIILLWISGVTHPELARL